MQKICVINVVGLTPELLQFAPRIALLGTATTWVPPIPAVTCTAQATMLTGLAPSEHGIVGNGWYFRETGEIRFWQQSRNLVQGEMLYDGIKTANLFWWFNQFSSVRWSVTPKPHYGSDGSKVFDIVDNSECQLVQSLGRFPFFSFWGPNAGLPATEWIARATAIVLNRNQPDLTFSYLPHLDYDFQRYASPDVTRVAEVDRCAGIVIDAALGIGAIPIVVSEYGLVPVTTSIAINRELRRAGLLEVRDGPFGEMLIPGDSAAFAVADHQLAHVYVNSANRSNEVRAVIQQIPGVDRVVHPEELNLHHVRSGNWIALANSDAWFNYFYWLSDDKAPDFARTVDIHRKPGYDPLELFSTSNIRGYFRLLQKKLGFRYRMDIVPLDTSLVGGSHGLITAPDKGPLIIGPNAPSSMLDFKNYIRALINS